MPVFATIVEANYISTREDKISFETLTDEDIQEIQRLSKDPKIAQRVTKCSAISLSLYVRVLSDIRKYSTIYLWS